MRTSLLLLVAACGNDGGEAQRDAATDASGEQTDAPTVLEDIHYIGRFDAQHRFAWPGTYVSTRFSGTTISVDLTAGGMNWFDITIDGVRQPPLDGNAAQQTYVLASGLAAGEHDLVLARRTEGFYGLSTLHGFPGSTLVPTPRPTRLVEFIGDSITCGYGVLGVGPSCPFTPDSEAETHAWGTLAANALGVAHVSIAYSGIGMYRNNGGQTTNTMPMFYGRTFPDVAGTAWDFSYTPDVIVINLGTNDFATGDPGTAFETAYASFVTMLLAKFPAAKILLATSPMLGGTEHTQHRTRLDTVAATLANPNVKVVEIAVQQASDGYGCDYHPNETTQQIMATAIVAEIRAVTGW